MATRKLARGQRAAKKPPPAPSGKPGPADLHSRAVHVVKRTAGRDVRAVLAARKRPGRASIHALRLATRRVLALVELIDAMNGETIDHSLERYLRKPFRAAGRLRDVHITLAQLETLAAPFPEARKFREALQRHKPNARANAIRALNASHPRRIERTIRRAADRLRDLLARPQWRAAAARRVKLRLTAGRRAIGRALEGAHSADPDAIHRLRIALKTQRYMLEHAFALGMTVRQFDVDGLRRMQDELGTITDSAVLLRIIDDYGKQHPRAAARLADMRAFVARRQARLAETLVGGVTGPGADGRTPVRREAANGSPRPHRPS